MNDQSKLHLLKKLDTRKLLEEIPKATDTLEATLREENSFRDLNTEYVASVGDCSVVKSLLADLVFKVPATNGGTTKPMTAPQREAWLTAQRTHSAINRQKSTMFTLENLRISSEMAKKRLEGIKIAISLKVAQLKFLSGND